VIPKPIELQVDEIPEILRERNQWVCWKYAKLSGSNSDRWSKLPISPVTGQLAKSTAESTWADFDTALAIFDGRRAFLAGVGFVFSRGDPFIGVDLDKCRDRETGRLATWAQAVVDELDSYTEVSPSGTGVKSILASGTPVPSRRRSTPGIEVYSSDRFFTITGNVFGTKVDVFDRTEQMLRIHSRLFPGLSSGTSPALALNEETERASDSEILERAGNAKNGWKFRGLWKGDLSLHGNNHSEADLALCRILAFWCGPAAKQIDRLFRRSALWRVKWDKPHFSDRSTYGQRTILRAIAAQGDRFYRWPTGTRRKTEVLVA